MNEAGEEGKAKASRKPKKLRKQYQNEKYPQVVLRFEDGHEIHIKQGQGKRFDCYGGETIKILSIWDPTSKERELVVSRKADDFEDATGES